MKVNIHWIPTLRCNYLCPYCVSTNKPDSLGELTSKDWIKIFNCRPFSKFKGIIEISGGEPTLYPNLIDVLNSIKNRFKFHFITNLSNFNIIKKMTEELLPENFEKIKLSFHPTQKGVTKEKFLKKALFLKENGYPISINFVMYKKQLFDFPKYNKYFSSKGINVLPLPFTAPDRFGETKSYSNFYSEREKKFLKKHAFNVFISFESNKKEFNLKPNELLFCTAGTSWFQLLSNGSIATCIANGRIGNNLYNLIDNKIKFLPNLSDNKYFLREFISANLKNVFTDVIRHMYHV